MVVKRSQVVHKLWNNFDVHFDNAQSYIERHYFSEMLKCGTIRPGGSLLLELFGGQNGGEKTTTVVFGECIIGAWFNGYGW